MRSEDGSIINECLNGEAEVFGLLVDKYKEGIYAYVYGKLRDFQDAQDVTQEVFLQAYRDLRSLKRWESFVFWLYRIASTRCKLWIRSQSRRVDQDFIEDQAPKTGDVLSLDSYRKDQLSESLRETLDLLPEIYREVLTLYYFGGMSIKDIAKAVGASPAAIGKRLSRARSELKKEMIIMTDTALEGQRLPAGFTFHIVEAVKRTKINPMPRTSGLPWGMSLAAGIIITVLSLGAHWSISNPVEMPVSLIPSNTKMLKAQTIPVDILVGPQILAEGKAQGNNGNTNPDPQMNTFMAPRGEDGEWTEKAGMQDPRWGHSSNVVDGKIYIFGGIDTIKCCTVASIVEVYDPAADTWQTVTDMPTPRNGLSVSAVNGIIYTIGGAPAKTIVEAYDPATDTWERKKDMPTQRLFLSTSVVNGKIYAIGGVSQNLGNANARLDAYDPATDSWEQRKDMPTARTLFSSSVVDGKVYAIGGFSGNNAGAKLYATVEAYDPATDTWEEKTEMPTPRAGLSTSVVDGKIYAIGGGFWHSSATVEIYDPATDTWTKEANMPTPRYLLSASAIDGEIYAIGGGPTVNINYPKGLVEALNTGFTESQSVSPAGKLPTTWGEVKDTADSK